MNSTLSNRSQSANHQRQLLLSMRVASARIAALERELDDYDALVTSLQDALIESQEWRTVTVKVLVAGLVANAIVVLSYLAHIKL